MKRKFSFNHDYRYQPMIEVVRQDVPLDGNPDCTETILVKRDPRTVPRRPCPVNQLATELRLGVPIERVNTVICEPTLANGFANDSNLVRYASQFSGSLKKRPPKEDPSPAPADNQPAPTNE